MLISPLEGDRHTGSMSSLLSLLLRKEASNAPLKSQHSVLVKQTSHGLHPSLQGIRSFWFAWLFLPELKDLADGISPSKWLWPSLCVLGTSQDRHATLAEPADLLYGSPVRVLTALTSRLLTLPSPLEMRCILLSGTGSCSPVSQSQAYLGTWIAATCHHPLSFCFSAWPFLLSVHLRTPPPCMYPICVS